MNTSGFIFAFIVPYHLEATGLFSVEATFALKQVFLVGSLLNIIASVVA